MKLIVGLGNPGKEYEKTRHNVGFSILDYFADKHNLLIKKSKFNGLYEKSTIVGKDVILLKPQTFMNNSGECISKFVKFYKFNAK